VFVRGDAATQQEGSFLSLPVAIAPNGGWVAQDVIVDVDEPVEQLALGLTLNGPGRAWLSEVELAELEPDAASPQGKALIDEAIDKIRDRAYYAQRVNWPLARERALRRASLGNEHALRYLLQQLKDNHSHLIAAQAAMAASENARTGDLGIDDRLIGGAAWIKVPSFRAAHAARERAFASDLRRRIVAQADRKSCGWIVDLRENAGGNMYPMLEGLAPLLGPDVLGYFEGRDGKREWRAEREVHGALPPLDRAPVAVLTGPRTASSGEAVAISFRGRPSTRSFGAPTAGMSTGNTAVPLSDGSIMAVMTSVELDRHGNRYGGKIPPDEPVASPVGPLPLEQDPAVTAALRWLDGQACPDR
jgi:hypothetical protein